MNFDSLTPHEKMLRTVADLKKREQRRKEGERAEEYHIINNSKRISARLRNERRRRGYKW